MFKSLKIYSDNVDNIGFWNKDDIIDEMIGCNYKVEGDNWIEYILDHLEIEDWIQEIILNPSFISGEFKQEFYGDLKVKKVLD
jgi:hypothetical protein